MMAQDGQKIVKLLAAFEGEVVDISQVPDTVFATRLLGEGFAAIPSADVSVIDVLAPSAGKLVQVFDTRHAFAMVTDEGLEILVHLGLDTVGLQGEPFEALAAMATTLTKAIWLSAWIGVRAKGLRAITPVVCTNMDQVASIEIISDGTIVALK